MIQRNFRTLLLEALEEFTRTGFVNEHALQAWIVRLHAALEVELPSDAFERRELARVLGQVFKRDVYGKGLLKRVPGVSRYTIDRIAPHLRAELDRRIFAGVDLIRLNKRKVTQQTLQRFSGWVTSMPAAGKPPTDLRRVARDIGKSVSTLKYEARRVSIDQSAKLSCAVAATVAHAEGAIGAVWNDRGAHDKSYNARPAHLKRSGTLFLIRGSWAMDDGLVKKGGLQYTDEIEDVGQLPMCSCFYTFLTSPRSLPETLLTAKGREFVKGAA